MIHQHDEGQLHPQHLYHDQQTWHQSHQYHKLRRYCHPHTTVTLVASPSPSASFITHHHHNHHHRRHHHRHHHHHHHHHHSMNMFLIGIAIINMVSYHNDASTALSPPPQQKHTKYFFLRHRIHASFTLSFVSHHASVDACTFYSCCFWAVPCAD